MFVLPGVCVPSWRHHIWPTEFHELPASALGQHGTALVCHRWVLYRQAIGLELIFFFPMYQCSIHKAETKWSIQIEKTNVSQIQKLKALIWVNLISVCIVRMALQCHRKCSDCSYCSLLVLNIRLA